MVEGRLKALKHVLRLASAAAGLLLLVLSCAGFRHAQASGSTLEGRTTFGCLCFLGVCFGLLLALAEAQREFFFFFFGFLRYRVGKSVLFGVSGVIMTLTGKSLSDQCACGSFVLLLVEGVACMALAVLHALAICVLGNNAKPSASQKSAPAVVSAPASEGWRLPGLPTRAAARAPTAAEDVAPAFTPVVQSAQPFEAPPARRQEDADDPNFPAWMRA